MKNFFVDNIEKRIDPSIPNYKLLIRFFIVLFALLFIAVMFWGFYLNFCFTQERLIDALKFVFIGGAGVLLMNYLTPLGK